MIVWNKVINSLLKNINDKINDDNDNDKKKHINFRMYFIHVRLIRFEALIQLQIST